MEGIICRNISKIYKGGTYALKRVSFKFPDRGIIAIIGRNGAGKTTLIRILATELMPSKGSAMINGIDAVKEPGKLREIIAIVPQEARMMPWLTPRQTALSYLLYRGFSYSEAVKRATRSLRKLGVSKFENEIGHKLSGGTKRKVLVATVLASEAKVVFLDEPTTGLDPISRADVWKLLMKLKNDYLIFLTTHYLEEAEQLADSIGIMDQGKLLAMGSIDELRRKVGQQYSIRVTQETKPKSLRGYRTTKFEGGHQLMTNEKKAFELSDKLIRERARFTINPVSLEDIFYSLAKKPIMDEEETGGDKW